MESFGRICSVIGSDRPGRKVGRLLRPECLGRALELLKNAHSASVVTGFFVPACGVPETDGPGGAVMLGRALERCGRSATLYTDFRCFSVLDACSRAVDGPVVRSAETGEEILESSPSLVVFLERLGRAADGRYYNMRAEDISTVTAPLDDAAAPALAAGIPVLAVGDGGTEAGMGAFRSELSSILPGYAHCLSVTQASLTLPVDVSDWGGYALAAMLSLVAGEWVGPDEEEIDRMLGALVGAGAVDGVTRRGEPTVDGFDAFVHRTVVRSLHEIMSSVIPKKKRAPF